MASTIDGSQFLLKDNWPFDPGFDRWAGPYMRGPASDATDWEGQNVAAADKKFAVGRKFVKYQKGATGINQGYSTFIYLRHGTAQTTALSAIKHIYTIENAAWGTSEAAEALYTVTNDAATACIAEPTGIAAVCLMTMTTNYYGWFWCGGVCPEVILTGMAGTYLTDGNVAVGAMELVTSAVNDELGFGVASGVEGICGLALNADA